MSVQIIRTNNLLEQIWSKLGVGGGTAANVTLIGDTVGLNKEVTQALVLTALQNILTAMTEVSETIWTDATNTFFLRRLVYDEELATYTVSYTLPDGTTYVPTLPIVPTGSNKDIEIVSSKYKASIANTGYSVGDILSENKFYDTTTNPATLLYTIWINETTDSVIATPILGDLIVVSQNIDKHKKNRIKGSADYNATITYVGVTTDVADITHTGTTDIGVETLIETFTYDGSNRIVDITYS